MASRPSHPDNDTRTRSDRTIAPIWLGYDRVIQLREWATENVYPLPGPDVAELVIGADPSVDLPLIDPGRAISRRHARLSQDQAGWYIEDLGSKNGTRVDGVSALKQRFLAPGVEIGIGGLTLVAENETIIGLRGYLARVLGWDAERRQAIDLALRAIRAAAIRRAPLVIVGADDLVAVARQIHLRTTPPGAPFVVGGRRPHGSDGRLRITAIEEDAAAALLRAAGGTICVRADELPAGYDELLTATSEPEAPAQLMICARKAERSEVVASPVVVPELTGRSRDDLHRIVLEYGADAVRELSASPPSFMARDREWVVRHEATSFANVEIATLRLVALNDAGNVHQAAGRLGLSHVGLGKWLKHRKLIE